MEQRILIYAPLGQDAPLAAKVLAVARIDSAVCRSAAELARELARGAAAVLTVEEALPSGAMAVLGEYADQQPGWSDLPILLLTRHGADSLNVRQAVAALGNVTLLERPVRTLTLITSAHALLRGRQKQYQVRETDRRKDEFLASLGHELRNPLAPIKTSATLLAQLYPDAAPVARIGAVITRQVDHLTRLVDDLLDVARINSGKIALRRAPVPLAEVLDHVNELCRGAAAQKHIALQLHRPCADALLDVDRARIIQVLANLVSNAIKFTAAGGSVTLRAAVAGECLMVSVKDNGIGLAPEVLERIFTLFEQSHTVQGQISSGLGIGLSLSRQFAEMHGGTVEAHSDGPGLGSEFVVRLPVVMGGAPEVASAATTAAATVAAAVVAPAPPPRVLIVDDNQDAADSLAALFELDHFQVAIAYDGHGALAALERGIPELIVMDLGMPGMDGYQAAQQIRLRPGCGQILMIALTGWGQSDARRRTQEAGFDHHLIKPVDFNQLRELATGLQARRRAAQ